MFAVENTLIVNTTNQVKVVFYDANGAVVNVFNANHKAQIEGFATILKAELKSNLKDVAAAPVAQVATLLFNDAIVKGQSFVIKIDMEKDLGLEYEPVDYSKPYYFTAKANLTATEFAQAVKAYIQQDLNAPVTITGNAATLTFTAKVAGVEFVVYIYEDLDLPYNGTWTVTTLADKGKGNYEDLLRLKGEAMLEPYQPSFERDGIPQPGASYTMYKWEIEHDYKDEIGGIKIPNETTKVQYPLVMYVNENLAALIAKLDLIVV